MIPKLEFPLSDKQSGSPSKLMNTDLDSPNQMDSFNKSLRGSNWADVIKHNTEIQGTIYGLDEKLNLVLAK